MVDRQHIQTTRTPTLDNNRNSVVDRQHVQRSQNDVNGNKNLQSDEPASTLFAKLLRDKEIGKYFMVLTVHKRKIYSIAV